MKRKVCIILCFSIIIMTGVFSGCRAKERELSDESIEEALGKEDVPEDENDNLVISTEESGFEVVDEADDENSAETTNALEMPLMAGTAFIVTETGYSLYHAYTNVSREEYDSEGRILRRLETSFPYYNNRRFEYQYDVCGNLVKKDSYEVDIESGNWKLSGWTEYSYKEDETGKQLSQIEREYRADGSWYEVVESVYDSGKLQKSRTTYDKQGDFVYQYRQIYDDAENLLLEAEYDSEGNVVLFEGYDSDVYQCFYQYWRYENTYDEQGNLKNQVCYGYENDEIRHSENTYDESGNLIKQIMYDSENAEMFHDEYVYDEENQLVWKSSADYEYYPYEYETAYEYDDNGNCIKETITDYVTDENNELVSNTYVSVERKYDENNRLLLLDFQDTWHEYTYTEIDSSEGKNEGF